MRMRDLVILLSVVWMFLAGGARVIAAPSEGVQEAKRKAAAELFHAGRNDEALSLIQEVVAADEKNYGDRLLMGQIYEKMGDTNAAVQQYRRVLEIVSAGGGTGAVGPHAAQTEAEKKLKVLDPTGGKIDALLEEFNRKLDALEREAGASRSMSSLERLFRMRAALWKTEGRKDRVGIEIIAKQAWQETGITMVPGQKYRIRAAGTWRFDGIETTAAGSNVRKTEWGPLGRLAATIDGKVVPLSETSVVSATTACKLTLISNAEVEVRLRGQGSLYVLISPE